MFGVSHENLIDSKQIFPAIETEDDITSTTRRLGFALYLATLDFVMAVMAQLPVKGAIACPEEPPVAPNDLSQIRFFDSSKHQLSRYFTRLAFPFRSSGRLLVPNRKPPRQ